MSCTASDVLLKAAEVMSESEGCCVGAFGEDSEGVGLGSGNLDRAVKFCREGAVFQAARLLRSNSPVLFDALDNLAVFCEREYNIEGVSLGTVVPHVNDNLMPGDKESAVLDLKRAAASATA